MSDIDDDLLLFAGEASEYEDDMPTRTSEDHKDTLGLKDTGKNNRKKSKATNKNNNDSEEEGEASSGNSSPSSLRSAPMDESDSESDVAAEFAEDIDKYPVEGKFIDSADKAKIMAMPEIDREQILADRATEVERERQSRLMKQILKSREAGMKKSDKKRKASTADIEGDFRKGSRQRTKLGGGKVGETSSGIDSLKRARAEKTDRQRRRDEDKDRNRDEGAYSHSDDDADRGSEGEWDQGRSKKERSVSPVYRDSKPAELHDYEKVRVGRSRFAMVCFYPGFEEAITGCYVRISIGLDKTTGQNIYRMALIKGFVEDRPYAMETPNGKQFKTTQYVRAAHGTAERNWPFITCSDSAFTEGEWSRYEKTCKTEKVPLPTKAKLSSKINDINKLVNRSWTEAELQEKLTKSGALLNKFIPIERNRLNNLIKEAKLNNDEERLKKLEKELEDLDGPKLAYNTSVKPSSKNSSPAGLSQQERLAILNRENRRKNAEQVRQAQINERRATKIVEAAMARGENVNEDHSRRVKTRAKLKHDVTDVLSSKKPETKEQISPVSQSSTLKQGSIVVPYLSKLAAEKKSGISLVRRPLMDDDIIGSIDLGIDLEL
ncbi:RNA polymerase-associated protein RTF1 [Golovinomyces cichoracearum]|uniref:RNA polymerase-associated protein RTF1 n=1 Tax=Golovinomyces cichoracearum TaxID=62708 RepID=A0A420IGN4_9PEZI|nr:RNA polymerase-associated protein RTF1 [Golovinomyces cichoracearum]